MVNIGSATMGGIKEKLLSLPFTKISALYLSLYVVVLKGMGV